MAISEKTIERLFSLQKRCINCGETFGLQTHHRIFVSEGELFLQKHLLEMKDIYEKCYGKKLEIWHLHDIQNLCVLCVECHEGGKGVHGGNFKLRDKLRKSFTCDITGFNVNYFKINSLY